MIEAVRERFAQLYPPAPTGQVSAGFAKAIRERYSNLWQDRSPEGRRQLLSFAFRNRDSTDERTEAIERAHGVARLMLDATLALGDPSSSQDDRKSAIATIDGAFTALERAEPRTKAQAELISAINAAATWARTGIASAEDAAAYALGWFEKLWPMYARDGNGPAFRQAVEAWLGRGNKKQWPATVDAARAAGIRTSVANARKTWQRWGTPRQR